MFLSNRDIADLIAWRRSLHRSPELSGEEGGTAKEVEAFLSPTSPDRVLTEAARPPERARAAAPGFSAKALGDARVVASGSVILLLALIGLSTLKLR